MTLEFTATLAGRIELPDRDGEAHFIATATARRPRRAIESTAGDAELGRQCLRVALAVAVDALRAQLTQAAAPLTAAWTSAVDVEGRLMLGVPPDHNDATGVVRLLVAAEPAKATAELSGARSLRVEISSNGDALDTLAAALDQPLAGLDRLWRAAGRRPAVGEVRTVDTPGGVRIQLSCALVPYTGELLMIGPGGVSRLGALDPRRPQPSPLERVLQWQRVTGDATWDVVVGGPYFILNRLARGHRTREQYRPRWWQRVLLAALGVPAGPAAKRGARTPIEAAQARLRARTLAVRALAFQTHLISTRRDARDLELIFVFRDPAIARQLQRSAGALRLLGLRPRSAHREERDGLLCVWFWPGFPRRGDGVGV